MNGSTPHPQPHDVLIIGAGPAGLTAALTLARQLHTVVVFDSGSYRNEQSKHMHTVVTWDHRDSKDFRAAARKNILEGYQTVQFQDVKVETVKQLGEGGLFEVVDVHGKSWQGRKLVLATGVVDVYPEIEGYAECWVTGVFHCLFCHGYEERHALSSGILAVGDLAAAMPALHFARNALQLTPKKVTLYTNGSSQLASDLSAQTSASSSQNFHIDSRPIARLSKAPHAAEVTIHFEDGSEVTEGFLGHKPKCVLKGDFHTQLGLDLSPMGDLKVAPPFHQTNLRGVFAAGDVGGPLKIANGALFTGAAVGAGVSAQLQADALGMKGMI